MHIWELFCGAGILSRVARERGHTVESVDHDQYGATTAVCDIMHWSLRAADRRPDFIWASPPCTSYSLAAIRHHRRNGVAVSEMAKLSDRIVLHTLALIAEARCPYVIENPMGLLRKQTFMEQLQRRTITQCTYGSQVMKPTDLWSDMFADLFNPDGWEPRPACKNGNPNCHHDRQPRSYAVRKERGLTKLGVQGATNAHVRAILPEALCVEVIEAAERHHARAQSLTHG